VSSAEFARYARSPLSRSAVRSVGFLERVPAAERPDLERKMGQPITQLWRAGVTAAPPRAVYFPLRLFAGKVKQMKDAAEPERVRIAVRDTGIGMLAEERANVFEPFFRTDDVKERGIKGTGLGLVIVEAFVEAHEGSVTVESEPGSGSCFTIEMPVRIRTPWMPPERLTTLNS
jgi:signal transduction histidine kinase